MSLIQFVQYIGIPLVISGVLIVVLLTGFAYLSYVERKTVSRFTIRYGPNRAGPYGLLQPIADAIKMAFKEELMPTHVDKEVYILAPALAVATALFAWAVIPLAPGEVIRGIYGFEFFGVTIPTALANVNIGLLYLMAVTGIATYGVILAGWSSNNKYSLLGSLRTSAQMISYELPLGVSLATVLLIVGSMNLVEIVEFQAEHLWTVLYFPIGPIAFVIFYICGLAEANRSPFDLPETENELVAGYITEYGGIRFALFFMGEYIHMITFSATAATLFFGGWHGPFVEQFPFLGVIYLIIKIAISIFMMIWIRASIPRLRYDKLMQFCWKFLLPVSLVNLVVAAIVVALFL